MLDSIIPIELKTAALEDGAFLMSRNECTNLECLLDRILKGNYVYNNSVGSDENATKVRNQMGS
jgi:hypothetical protein